MPLQSKFITFQLDLWPHSNHQKDGKLGFSREILSPYLSKSPDQLLGLYNSSFCLGRKANSEWQIKFAKKRNELPRTYIKTGFLFFAPKHQLWPLESNSTINQTQPNYSHRTHLRRPTRLLRLDILQTNMSCDICTGIFQTRSFHAENTFYAQQQF